MEKGLTKEELKEALKECFKDELLLVAFMKTQRGFNDKDIMIIRQFAAAELVYELSEGIDNENNA